jgi:hypothetical protein
VCLATFDFGVRHRLGAKVAIRAIRRTGFGVNFGEKGVMSIAGDNCQIFDPSNKLVREIKRATGANISQTLPPPFATAPNSTPKSRRDRRQRCVVTSATSPGARVRPWISTRPRAK